MIELKIYKDSNEEWVITKNGTPIVPPRGSADDAIDEWSFFERLISSSKNRGADLFMTNREINDAVIRLKLESLSL
jgi:hypothetical protein